MESVARRRLVVQEISSDFDTDNENDNDEDSDNGAWYLSGYDFIKTVGKDSLLRTHT